MGDPARDGEQPMDVQQAYDLALREFAKSLDRLYVERGAPPLRKLASRGKQLPPSTVSEALSGRRLPSIDLTTDLVRALMAQSANHEIDQRVNEWRAKWQEVMVLKRRVPRASRDRPPAGRPSPTASGISLNAEDSSEVDQVNLIGEADAAAARIIGEATDKAEEIIAAAHAEADRIRSANASEITLYTENSSFYEATRRAVEAARRRVYVTHAKSIPPDERDIAFEQHLQACRKWANSSPEHVFRRVVINAQSPSMSGYFQQELAEVMRARASRRHYSIRMLRNIGQDVGGIAIGIYDEDQVFISYVSGADRIVGIGIRAREVVRSFFEHYYDNLWSAAVDIEKIL